MSGVTEKSRFAMTSVLHRTDSDQVQHISYRQWAGAADLATGSAEGTVVCADRLTIGVPAGSGTYQDPHDESSLMSYEVASWTSPEVTPGFAFSELVASWNTLTPPGTWVEITAHVVTQDGRRSKGYSLGRWSMDRGTINRTSVPGQGDEIADVSTDVLVARGGQTLRTWQLTVSLHRLTGTIVTPEVSLVAAVASSLPRERTPMPQRIAATGARNALDVPAYSQELYIGQYTQFSGGGKAWCSPTSTAMVLTYFGAGPAGSELAWVGEDQPNPVVVHAAAHTYDWDYGTGNWPFNTAYAGELGLRGFVTRLRSLNEAEQFIAAGIPLVASVTFTGDDLVGAGYSTQGHLMVIVGFTDSGDVIVNDPASHLMAADSAVRTVYDRREFRSAWLTGSGGIVYVIRPADLPLPPPPPEANW